jgi:outer membrane usher protein
VIVTVIRPHQARMLLVNSAGVAALLLFCTCPAFAQGGVATAAQSGAAPASTPVPNNSAKRINPTGRDISLTVPLREIGPLGQVQITLKANGTILILERDFAAAISRLVKPTALAPLTALAGPDGYVSADNLARNGFVITYDPNAVELVVQIPLQARAGGVVDIGIPGNDTVQPDTSAAFASYINYRIGENYTFQGQTNGQPSAAFLANLEWGGRLFNKVAFENYATVDQLNPNVFDRTASRLIYDMPGPALRLTAGDLLTQSVALQSTPEISGLNISHLINTFYPSSWSSGSSSRSLNLLRASDVQLLVNNQTVSQLHLNPGTYDLRNLPVGQGANNLQAIITDDTGQRIVQNFDFFSDINLLDEGLDEYTASLGVLAPLGSNGPDYHTNEAAMSGFYRRGWTQQFTGGFNVQATRENQMGGLDAVLGTRFGLFSLDGAFNRQSAGENGYAGWLRYRFTGRPEEFAYFQQTFDFSAEYRSAYFTPVIDTQFAHAPLFFNSQELQFSGTMNQPLSRDFGLQITGDYQISRLSHSNSESISAIVNYNAPFNSTIGLGVSYQFSGSESSFATAPVPGGTVVSPFVQASGFSFTLSLTHRFDSADLLTVSADRFQQRADFTRSPLSQIDDYYASGDISHVNDQITGNATAAYETSRGDIGVQYNNNLTEGGSFTSQQAGVFFDGSIGLADSNVGLGRHVSDAFGVVSADPSLSDKAIVIEASGSHTPLAEAAPPLGAAVVPFTSYGKQVLPYSVPDAPAGYDLGTGNFEVYPWLHSGFALKVGTPYNATAIGVLLDQAGTPISLRTGQAVSEDDPKAPPVSVITNRTGNFAAAGLAFGRYRLTMSGDPALVYHFTISKTDDLLTRLKNVRPDAASPGGQP